MRTLALVSALLLASCTDVPQPFDLDHPRIMAVRIDPPALAPGDVASIAPLVTDPTAQPRIAAPAEVEVALPPEAAAFASLLVREPDGWRLTAPDEATLAELRVAGGLAADALVIVPLEIRIAGLTGPGEGPLVASKTVALGARAANPPAPAILIDGASPPAVMRAGAEITLGIAAPDPAHSYRWFSSVGDLMGFTRAEATLDAEVPPADQRGQIAVVVRDQAGGTAWTLVSVEVAP